MPIPLPILSRRENFAVRFKGEDLCAVVDTDSVAEVMRDCGDFRGVVCVQRWSSSAAGIAGDAFAQRRRGARPLRDGRETQRMIGPPLQRNVRERDAEPDALVTVTVTVRYEPMEQRP